MKLADFRSDTSEQLSIRSLFYMWKEAENVEFYFIRIFISQNFLSHFSLISLVGIVEQSGKLTNFTCSEKKISRERSLDGKILFRISFFFFFLFHLLRTFSRILIYRVKNNHKFSARSIPKIIHHRIYVK